MRRPLLGLLGPSLLLLSACAAGPRSVDGVPPLPVPTAPDEPRPTTSLPPTPPASAADGWRITGAQAFAPPASAPTTADRRVDVSLSFDQAPVAVVADAVFAQVLRRPFRVDPEVQGAITLKAGGRMSERDLLGLVDQALRGAGAALAEEPGGAFAVVSATKAPALSRPPSLGFSSAASYTGGVFIYPARNVSATELARLLQPLAGASAQIRTDEKREHVYLSGDPTTVNALVRTAQMFDVDWMKGLNFQFFALRYATPGELSKELRRIMGGADGPVGSQVDFIEIDRLNGLIVVAKSPARLDEIHAWIERLDRPSPLAGRRLRTLPLSNVDAEELVATISALTGSSSSGASSAAAVAGSNGGAAATASASSGSATLNAMRITAAPRANAILLFADDSEFENVRNLVRELDVPPAQVLIEATVAEVTLNDQLKFGVQWFFDSGDFTGGFSTTTNDAAASSFPGFSVRYLGSDFRAVLNALATVTDVQLISTPRILVLANETASMQVGDQVPIVTQTAVGDQDDSRIVNSINYRDTGVVLKVTPRVGDQGRMFIDLSQEVSEVTGTSSSDIDSPTFVTRQFSTKIQVEDGQVVALGGLLRNASSVGDTGVPYLSRIPVAGALFRARDRTVRQTELVVFLHPRIVRSRGQADQVTDQLAAGLEALGLNRGAR